MHDNSGTRDEHLVPFTGTIDWEAAMMETQKIGYDGVLMFEVADTGDPVDVLRRSVKAQGAAGKDVRHRSDPAIIAVQTTMRASIHRHIPITKASRSPSTGGCTTAGRAERSTF